MRLAACGLRFAVPHGGRGKDLDIHFHMILSTSFLNTLWQIRSHHATCTCIVAPGSGPPAERAERSSTIASRAEGYRTLCADHKSSSHISKRAGQQVSSSYIHDIPSTSLQLDLIRVMTLNIHTSSTYLVFRTPRASAPLVPHNHPSFLTCGRKDQQKAVPALVTRHDQMKRSRACAMHAVEIEVKA